MEVPDIAAIVGIVGGILAIFLAIMVFSKDEMAIRCKKCKYEGPAQSVPTHLGSVQHKLVCPECGGDNWVRIDGVSGPNE
jgi:Zn finger protein HypA/HybF involved in hydrogenase expression